MSPLAITPERLSEFWRVRRSCPAIPPDAHEELCADVIVPGVPLVSALTSGLTISEISIPIVPACGAGVPVA